MEELLNMLVGGTRADRDAFLAFVRHENPPSWWCRFDPAQWAGWPIEWVSDPRSVEDGVMATAVKPDRPWWHGKLLRDVNGIRLRTRRPMGNDLVRIPVGTEVTVRTSGNDWHLLRIEADPCPHCGVSARVTRVSRDDLEAVVP